MPFKTTPEIDFSSVGLITDIPTHSLPQGAWNDCLNLRCKDGTVQGVNRFSDVDWALHGDHHYLAPEHEAVVALSEANTALNSAKDTLQVIKDEITASVEAAQVVLSDLEDDVIDLRVELVSLYTAASLAVTAFNDTDPTLLLELDAANDALTDAQSASDGAQAALDLITDTESNEYDAALVIRDASLVTLEDATAAQVTAQAAYNVLTAIVRTDMEDKQLAMNTANTAVEDKLEEINVASDVVAAQQTIVTDIQQTPVAPEYQDVIDAAQVAVDIAEIAYTEAWFASTPIAPSDSVITDGSVVALTQFTPSGADHLIIAYIVKGTDNLGHVVLYDTDPLSTAPYNDVSNSILPFSFDDKYPPQLFVFNEILIVNPATDSQPMWTDAKVLSGSLQAMPGWISDSDTNPIIARILKPFNSRLMAMNILERHGEGTADDITTPIDILWSSHITTKNSLDGTEWLASYVNTAGSSFATETPGKILDGGQLGEFFIAYKSDAVIRISETGDAFVLSFDSIFEDDGIYSTRCFANIGNSQHLVVGNYGVFIHDGQSQKTDIAKGIFQDTIFDLVNPAWKDRSFCFQQTRDKEVWFCFPSATTDTSGCDLAFVYDYNEKKLHKRSLPSLTDIYETEINGKLEIYAAKPSASNIQRLSNDTYEADGFFVHEDDNLEDNTAIKWINGAYLDSSRPFKIGLSATNHLTDSKTYTLKIFDPSNSYKSDFRVTGRYINLKVQMDGDKNPSLGKLQFDIKLAGKR